MGRAPPRWGGLFYCHEFLGPSQQDVTHFGVKIVAFVLKEIVKRIIDVIASPWKSVGVSHVGAILFLEHSHELINTSIAHIAFWRWTRMNIRIFSKKFMLLHLLVTLLEVGQLHKWPRFRFSDVFKFPEIENLFKIYDNYLIIRKNL